MLFPTLRRDWDGIYLAGDRIGLRLHPNAEGTISVTVIGLKALTEFDRPCRLSGDDLPDFAESEIQVHDAQLECFVAAADAPLLRIGFKLELEPGMAPLLRAWLPKLAAVAAASKAIAETFHAQLPHPIYHMLSAITSVVARIALDGWKVEHSIAYERGHGTWSSEHEFMAQFDAEAVRQVLAAVASTPRLEKVT